MYLKAFGKSNNKQINFKDGYKPDRYDIRFAELKLEYKYIVKVENNGDTEWLMGNEDDAKLLMID